MPYSDPDEAAARWWDKSRGVVLGVLIIALAGFFAYRSSLGSRFLYDDIKLIVTNPAIRSHAHLRELIAGGRPIRALTFMMDYSLWGYSPRGYHRTNLLLHIAAASLLFLFLRAVFRKFGLALGAGLLFAVHPAGIEAVVAVSHRKEMLALSFMLLSLLAYKYAAWPGSAGSEHRGYWERPKWLWYSVSFIAYLFALGSKQVAIVVPLLMWLLDMLISGQSALRTLRNRWYLYLPPVAIPLLFFMVKLGDWRAFGAFPSSGMFGAVYFKIIAVSCWAITQYVKVMLWPVHLNVDHSIPMPGAGSVIVGVVIFLGMLFAAMKLRDKPVLAFGLFWIPVNLAPVLNLIPANQPFSERYLYIPLAGACILFSAALQAVSERARPVRFFRALFFIWMSSLSAFFWVVFSWKYSEITWVYIPIALSGAACFWIAMRILSRWSGRWAPVAQVAAAALIIAGLMAGTPRLLHQRDNEEVLWTQEQYIKAMEIYKEKFSIPDSQLDPKNFKARRGLNFGAAFGIIGLALFAGLIGGARKGSKGVPESAIGLSLIAMMFGALTINQIDRWRADSRLWATTIKENPGSVRGTVNLGIAYRRNGNYEEAVWAYRRAEKLDPDNSLTHYDLALALLRLGREEEAEKEFIETIRCDPRYVEAHMNLGNLYHVEGKAVAALNEYRQVVQLDPSNARAFFNMAMVYQSTGDYIDAMEACKKAIEIRPDYQKALEMCAPR